MMYDDVPLISAKLSSLFLARLFIHPWFRVLNIHCEYLLSDS